MTCRYTETAWSDVLYNCVRRTPGGIAAAALFLTRRRGRSIHPETLRTKLRGADGECISVEMAALLTEWMDEFAGGAEYSRDWLLALSAENGLSVDLVPPAPEGGLKCEIEAMQQKVMKLAALTGQVAGTAVSAAADGKVTQEEADVLVPITRDLRTMCHRLERTILRAVGC